MALERQAETKSDYLDGEMFAMTGASLEHNRIAFDVAHALEAQFQSRKCETFASDMRVRTPSGLFTYPDVVVLCGEPRFDDSETDTLLNPKLIVEVLSKSTAAYDRLTKLPHYQTIPTLAEILLIAQDRCHVEHRIRQTEGEWLTFEVDDLGETLELPSLGCSLELIQIYRRVLGQPVEA